MKKMLFTGCACAAVALFTLAMACNNQANSVAATTQPASHDSLIKRGQYLVTIMGCNDCHSPKIMGPHGPEIDTTKALSGHPAGLPIGPVDTTVMKWWVLFGPMTTAAAGPWGMSFSSNITSSTTAGIGSWTEERFFKAIREGKSKGLEGNRMLLPPMPWQEIAKASDDDLKAVFAYLKSTKPIDNVVPQPIPPGQLAKK